MSNLEGITSRMNALSQPKDLVGIGLYTLADAAHLLKTPRRNLRRWMLGYDYTRDGTTRHVQPLWKSDIQFEDSEVELSFRDLIELRFVKAFTEKGIGLKAIRHCLDFAQECIQSDRPFLSGKFRTDGKTIFLESLEKSNDPKLLDLRNKQFVFKTVVEQTFRDLDLEDNIVSQWRPFRGKQSIVIDPMRSFGQPVASDSGVPTIALAEAVEVEGSAKQVAALFEVDLKVVRDAVKYHQELQAA